MQQDINLTIYLLQRYYPDECELAGPANVRAVAAGSSTILKPQSGYGLDLGEILTTLAAVVTFINHSIAIIKASRSPEHKSQEGLNLPEAIKKAEPGPVSPEIAELINQEIQRQLAHTTKKEQLEES